MQQFYLTLAVIVLSWREASCVCDTNWIDASDEYCYKLIPNVKQYAAILRCQAINGGSLFEARPQKVKTISALMDQVSLIGDGRCIWNSGTFDKFRKHQPDYYKYSVGGTYVRKRNGAKMKSGNNLLNCLCWDSDMKKYRRKKCKELLSAFCKKAKPSTTTLTTTSTTQTTTTRTTTTTSTTSTSTKTTTTAAEITTTSTNVVTSTSATTPATTTATTSTTSTSSTTSTTSTTTENVCNCGKCPATSRIGGGSNAVEDSICWQLFLLPYYQPSNGGDPALLWVCGAIIIDKKYALTSAYCLSPPQFESGGVTYTLALVSIIAGLHSTTDEDGYHAVSVSSIIKHGSFVEENPYAGSDIAIMELWEETPEFDFNSVGPICMPELNEAFDAGTSVQISGWGSGGADENVLQQGSSNLVDNSQCQSQLGNEVGTTIMDSQICILSNDAVVPCRGGDIGGPVTTVVNDRAKLVGILSYGSFADGESCSKTSVPYALTRVSYFMDWIEANTPDRTCF